MSKKVVLSGYFGFKNFGDEAILSVLVNKLEQYNHNITIITSNPEYTGEKFKNVRCVKTFDLKNIIAELISTDFLISGGGSLLQDTTSFKSLIYYLTVIFIALVFQKKVIIFAQGIGPIKNPLGTILTRLILKYCTFISVRDSKSAELLKSWGINSELVCDPVFSTKIPYTDKENIVAIQLRQFKTLNKDFLDRLAYKVINEFTNENIEIYSFQDEIDLEICKNFANTLQLLNPEKKITVLSNLADKEIIEKLSRAKYLIAMRFHAIIVGLLSGIKTLAINYDIKVEKLSSEYKLPILDLHKEFENQ